MKKGMFIAIEGNDGAGKTTAAKALVQALQKEGYPVLYTREPGGTPIAEQIRNILLSTENGEMNARTEALLYAAARSEHVRHVIRPAVEAGTIVICDRFLDSSLAYQGEGRKLGMGNIRALNDFVLEGYRPDFTLFFELSTEECAKRMKQRGQENRLDLEESQFHQAVRRGFEKLREYDPLAYITIDASKTPDRVLEQALQAVRERLA